MWMPYSDQARPWKVSRCAAAAVGVGQAVVPISGKAGASVVGATRGRGARAGPDPARPPFSRKRYGMTRTFAPGHAVRRARVFAPDRRVVPVRQSLGLRGFVREGFPALASKLSRSPGQACGCLGVSNNRLLTSFVERLSPRWHPSRGFQLCGPYRPREAITPDWSEKISFPLS